MDFFYLGELVYDELMIYNAEMYIDEDWDDGWWDDVDDYNGDNQYDIRPFTYFNYDQNSNTNTNTFGAVAYSYGDHDSVLEYNEYMRQQIEILRWYYSYDNTYWNDPDDPNDEDDPENPHPEWANWAGEDNNMNTWDDTLAPGGSWDNYLYYRNFTDKNINLPVDGNYPYQPGYSLYWFMLKYANGDSRFEWYHAGQSAGVDCVGLVSRCASYDDNTYLLPDLYRWPWTNNNDEAEDYYSRRRSLVIEEDPNRTYYHLDKICMKTDTDKSNLASIVPGDILYFWWANNEAYHVTMVKSIEFIGDTRIPSLTNAVEVNQFLNNIQLIEAAWGEEATDPDPDGNPYARVIKFHTAYFYRNYNWIFGRLKQ